MRRQSQQSRACQAAPPPPPPAYQPAKEGVRNTTEHVPTLPCAPCVSLKLAALYAKLGRAGTLHLRGSVWGVGGIYHFYHLPSSAVTLLTALVSCCCRRGLPCSVDDLHTYATFLHPQWRVPGPCSSPTPQANLGRRRTLRLPFAPAVRPTCAHANKPFLRRNVLSSSLFMPFAPWAANVASHPIKPPLNQA